MGQAANKDYSLQMIVRILAETIALMILISDDKRKLSSLVASYKSKRGHLKFVELRAAVNDDALYNQALSHLSVDDVRYALSALRLPSNAQLVQGFMLELEADRVPYLC